ncbi:MAG: hypothetical protein ABSA30_12405 [Candidatus Aminicenantales bacterium]
MVRHLAEKKRRTPGLAAVGAAMLLLLPAPACRRGDRYRQTRSLVTRYAEALDAFSSAVDKAKDSKPIVAAIDAWVDAARGMAPGIKALGKSRPELADPASWPVDLRDLLARLDAAQARMLTAMAKAMQYADDPAVPAARTKLESVQKLLE